MSIAGYSGKPVPTKLGLKPGMRVLLVGAPDGFALGSDEVTVVTRTTGAPFDLILAFCPDAAMMTRRFAALWDKIGTAGALWIAWPKKNGPLASDVGENQIREVGLAAGLVDVKVIAIDEAWSALKFVRRLKDR